MYNYYEAKTNVMIRFDAENHSTTCPICDAAFEYIFQIAFLLENSGLVLLAYAFNQYCVSTWKG